MAAYAHDLAAFGVAVVPLLDASARAAWEERLWVAMDEFPEYKIKGRAVQRVLGGFGAFGNPSSFHHPTVRRFRSSLKAALRPLFAAYAEMVLGTTDGVALEALFDRLCVRCEAFKRPVPEAWHRDIYDGESYKLRPLPHSIPADDSDDDEPLDERHRRKTTAAPRLREDLLFGGWTNLDAREQAFVCLPKTHDEPLRGKKGFASFDEAEIKEYRFNERLAAQASGRMGNTVRFNAKGEVIVPPGHTIVFLQRLIHSVKGGKQPDTPALRLFHGFRLTGERASLMDHAVAVENGGVPRIPSGQLPPMFSSNHFAFFCSDKTSEWRDWSVRTFYDVCLFERDGKKTYKTPGSKDNRNPFVNHAKVRAMPSLAEMGLWTEAYAYSAHDRAVLTPEPLAP